MLCQHLDSALAFALAVFFEGLSQHGLSAGLVHALIEGKVSAALRLLDGPAGKHPGQFGHIFLGISAIHAQGVQLHDFAGVILIQSAALPLLLLLLLLVLVLSAKVHVLPAAIETFLTRPLSALGHIGVWPYALPI